MKYSTKYLSAIFGLLFFASCCPEGHTNSTKSSSVVDAILSPMSSSQYDAQRGQRLAKRIELHKDVVPVGPVDGRPLFWATPRKDSFKGLTSTVQQNGQVVNMFDAWVPKGTKPSDGYDRVNYFLYRFASSSTLNGQVAANDQYVFETELWRLANNTWCPIFSKMDINIVKAEERYIKYRNNPSNEKFIDIKIFTGSSDGFIGELGFQDYNPLTSDCHQNDIRLPANSKFYYQPQRKNDDQFGGIIKLKTVPIYKVTDEKGTLAPSLDASGNVEKVLLATTAATCYYNFSTGMASGCLGDKLAWGNVLLGYYTEGDDTDFANVTMMNWTPGDWIGTRYKEYDPDYHYLKAQSVIDADLLVTKLDAKNNMFNVRLVFTPDGEGAPPMIVDSGESTQIDLPFFYAVKSNYNFLDFTKFKRTLNRPEGLLGALTKRSYFLDKNGVAMTYLTEDTRPSAAPKDLLGPQAIICWTDECQRLNPNYDPASDSVAKYLSIGNGIRLNLKGQPFYEYRAKTKPNLDLYHDSYWLGDADFLRINPLFKFAKYGNEKLGMFAVNSVTNSFATPTGQGLFQQGLPKEFKQYQNYVQCFISNAYNIMEDFDDESMNCSLASLKIFPIFDKQDPFVRKDSNLTMGTISADENQFGASTFFHPPKHYYENYIGKGAAVFNYPENKAIELEITQHLGVPVSKAMAFYYSANNTGTPQDDRVMIMVRMTDNSEVPVSIGKNNPTIQNDGGVAMCSIGRKDVNLPLTTDNLDLNSCDANSVILSPSNVFSTINDSRNVKTTPKKISHSISPDGKVYINYFAKNNAVVTGKINRLTRKPGDNINWQLLNYGREGKCTTAITRISKEVSESTDSGQAYLKNFLKFAKSAVANHLFLLLDLTSEEVEAPPGSAEALEATWELYEAFSDAKEASETEVDSFTFDPNNEIRTSCVIN